MELWRRILPTRERGDAKDIESAAVTVPGGTGARDVWGRWALILEAVEG